MTFVAAFSPSLISRFLVQKKSLIFAKKNLTFKLWKDFLLFYSLTQMLPFLTVKLCQGLKVIKDFHLVVVREGKGYWFNSQMVKTDLYL